MALRFAPLLVFLAAAAYFLVGAAQRDLWTTGEHRYAEVARVLTAPGHDHVVPHLNGEIYPDKPPLFFWLAGAPHALGLDLAVAAKLPSLLAAAFAVMLVFLLARRWYGTAAGLVAAGVLATTDLFDWAARMAHLDALLTAFITAALYCWVRARETPREDRAARDGWTALGFLAIGGGILVKGPPAVIVPGVTVLVATLGSSPRRILSRRLVWGSLLALLPGAVWLAVAWTRAGGGYVDALLRGHAIGHTVGEVDKLQPWHYYAWNVPAHLMPWTLLLPAAVVAVFAWRRFTERQTDRLLLAWLFASWLVFSLSPAKRELYMLPIHPAAALLVARLFRDVADAPLRAGEAIVRLPRLLFAGAGCAAGALAAVVALLVVTGADRVVLGALVPEGAPAPAWHAKYAALVATHTAPGLVAAAALSALAAWAGLSAWRSTSALRTGAALVATAACFHLADAAVVRPARDADASPRAFLDAVRARIGDAPLERLGTDGGLQYAVNWTLERDSVPQTRSGRLAAAFLASGGDAPRFVVTDAEQLADFGPVDGAVELFRVERRRNPALVLLGNPAAAASR